MCSWDDFVKTSFGVNKVNINVSHHFNDFFCLYLPDTSTKLSQVLYDFPLFGLYYVLVVPHLPMVRRNHFAGILYIQDKLFKNM